MTEHLSKQIETYIRKGQPGVLCIHFEFIYVVCIHFAFINVVCIHFAFINVYIHFAVIKVCIHFAFINVVCIHFAFNVALLQLIDLFSKHI